MKSYVYVIEQRTFVGFNQLDRIRLRVSFRIQL